MWLQYGNPPLYPWIAGFTRAAPSSVVRAAIFTISRTRQNLLLTWLTRFGALAYIAPTRRAAARRDGAPAKLLTDNGDQPPMCFNRGCRLRRLSGLFGERGFAVPGCLTGESEERETWTAESLRAVPNAEQFRIGFGRTRLRRSTFQVNTSFVPKGAENGGDPRQTL